MPILSNGDNKQVNVGKMQVKGLTMATFHWPWSHLSLIGE